MGDGKWEMVAGETPPASNAGTGSLRSDNLAERRDMQLLKRETGAGIAEIKPGPREECGRGRGASRGP